MAVFVCVIAGKWHLTRVLLLSAFVFLFGGLWAPLDSLIM